MPLSLVEIIVLVLITGFLLVLFGPKALKGLREFVKELFRTLFGLKKDIEDVKKEFKKE